ncbi:1-acyl-sn-glycerol-3-phosphate acyltransferase [Rubellimicrobium mesophilum DSM 19309]|uniref:1-acyl-sn-glycerol-3-phosphate acyltransferase n=1 Tax=Rubellimicrobium mesophilum DSM 19309 TaxID=442562 RepID=A0A017HIJ9_9RHOB|nr:1-acyl-sn-glycerol-3-phosphate acyltransferase [Rubellimicrobium mesophilum DSM 19309]
MARGGPLTVLLVLGLAIKMAIRLVERPLCGPRRPVSPWVTVLVCRGALALLGIRLEVAGRPMRGPGAMVANHSSWLDIFALNALAPIVFVAKSEVADWPGIGHLARATGTLFIRREARGEVAEQALAITGRLTHGETLLFFPEGTSTDGRRVLPFKPALFAGLLAPGLPERLAVQPVTLSWVSPEGEDPRFYGWWGGMEFGSHALSVLASRRAGRVRVTYHAPIRVAGRDRKSLGAEAETAVRSAL